jgi:hypothetical protein
MAGAKEEAMTGLGKFQRQLVVVLGALLMSAITVGSAVGPAHSLGPARVSTLA